MVIIYPRAPEYSSRLLCETYGLRAVLGAAGLQQRFSRDRDSHSDGDVHSVARSSPFPQDAAARLVNERALKERGAGQVLVSLKTTLPRSFGVSTRGQAEMCQNDEAASGRGRM